MIYLDHNATAPLRPGVFAAMRPWFEEHPGNANSVHRAGRLARQAVEQAREQVAALLGAQPGEVLFTSGATESINWALQGLRPGAPRCVGASEHDAVLQALPQARRLAVDGQGLIDPAALPETLAAQGEAGLLSLMWANNETGVLQDMPAIAAAAAAAGWWLHSDATQAVGRLSIDFAASGLVALSCSAHKLGGPKGVGALLLRGGHAIERGQRGGSHERGLRAGTLNVPGIVGFGAACAAAGKALAEESARLRRWREEFEAQLLASIPGSEVFGAQAPRLPNTSFFALPGWHSEALLIALDKRGFALASGSACHSGSDTPSHVLAAMGVPTPRALGAVRMSLGHDSREADLQALLAALQELAGETAGGGRFAGLLNG